MRNRKSESSLSKFFDKLQSNKNKDTDRVQDPKGHNLISFIRQEFGFKSSLPVITRLNELIKLGYIGESIYDGQALFSVKLLKTQWQEPEPPKKPKSIKPKKPVEKLFKKPFTVEKPVIEKKDELTALAPVAPVIAPAVQEKRFAILIDYENLKKHVSTARLLDFSWLFDPILSQGKIIVGYVFFPEHYGNNMPVKTLSNIHRLFCVVCPKNISSNGAFKDKDIVDSRMDELGRFLAEHTDITDLVIVSGDADFQGLVQFARWQQKEVKLVSAANAISSRFRLDEKLEKQLV